MPSKEKHMGLNLQNGKRKDVIFIGNSRTLYHISTLIMQQQGLNVYNLGISGHGTPDFPSMVDHALRYHPKTIALNLAAAYFHVKLTVPKDVDRDDLVAYVKSGQSTHYIIKAFTQYLRSWFLVDAYSTNINIRVRSAYQAFDPKKFHFSLKHIKKGFSNPLFTANKTYQFDKRFVKCKVFRMAYPKKIDATAMCTNGDGVLAGNNLHQVATQEDAIKNTTDSKLNVKQLQLFNYIINKIKRAGVKPIVIFTPVFQNSYTAHYIKETAAKINAPIIDLTNAKLSNAMWADRGHLNYKGRYVYTHMVAKQLKHIQ